MSREIDLDPPVLTTPRLCLLMLPPDQAARQCRYFLDNKQHLAPWEPIRPPGFYAEDFWQWRLEQNLDDFRGDRSLRLALVERDAPDGAVVGQVGFSNFVRGSMQGCTLGYSIAASHEGRGLMFEALEAGVAHVFGHMGMHRVEANYLPDNERSARLLARLGFREEGFSRDYLFIAGAWRDHVRTALVNPTPMRPPALG
jgi:[ribosomal protein S5]-alanine N-acetyltransferase